MPRRGAGSGAPAPEGGGSRIVIDDAGSKRPFMRGILIHSLMARGMSFEDAYRVASRVRDRIRGQEITRADLAGLVNELCTASGVLVEAPPPILSPDIAVLGPDGAMTPFSKGTLSQSLLAAALEPNEAFDVARRLEERLVRSHVRQIERRDLRRLAFETLRANADERVAQRYLVWRKYQDPEKPVVILLGGATGVGKTSLALQVAHRLGIGRVISTDAIRQVMRIMLSPELMPAIHKSSYDAWTAVGFEATPGADPVVEAFLDQAEVVAVGARALIERAIEERTSLVMDGVSLLPGRLGLDAYADRAHVIFLAVAVLDREAFASRFAARAQDEARPAHRYVANLDAILRIQDYILEQAEAHDVPIVENASFDRSVLSIIRIVTESLAQKEGFDATALL
jgi:2-phosphoglycerate kinase